MSVFLRPLLFFLLLVSAAPEAVGICRWVDSEGVVHYAETCPEDAGASEVRIEPPPPQEQIEATARRAQALQSEVRTRHAQTELLKEQMAAEEKALEATSEALNRRCAEARWNLQILQTQLPVYYDAENQLHHNRSLHHYWYEGPRSWLDDQQRADQILHYADIEEQACTGSEADIRERIRIYMEKGHNEACLSLENKLAEMKKASTGIPSDEMRELEKIIAGKCR